MSRRSTRQSSDWSRCSEGFSDVILNNADIKQKTAVSSKHASIKNDFSHGNIFEKLAFSTEETSQSITWSSSDDELPASTKKAEPEKPPSVPKTKPVTSGGKKRKKSRSPRGRKARKKLNSHLKVDSSEVLDIKSDSDTEIVSSNMPASEQSSEAAIKCYDSGTEEGSTQQAEPSQVTDTQESPSIANSVSTTSPITQTGTGLKASDWVKTLQLKTPSKLDNQSDLPEVEDSTKKKRKFCRDGLADRLGKLVARDKSTVRMWSHQLNKPSLSQDSKALSLVVCGYETLYSLQAVRCTLLPWQPEATGGQGQSDLGSGNTGAEEKLVMFPATQAEQLSLQLGTILKIFPPWQQLELRDGREILLCTKYCQVISHPDDTELAQTGATTLAETGPGDVTGEDIQPVKASWNCPCVQGLCKNQTLCPAYQFPCVPGWIKVPTGTSAATSDGKDDNSNELKNSEAQKAKERSASHLHTVPRSADSLPEEPVFDSLLESIERGRTQASEDNERNSKVLCFKGHVRRAVWCREPSDSKSCRLLVEDDVGMVCEIKLMADGLTALGTDPAALEGKSYLFSGLKVADRLVREKNPCLFTMIDSVWSGKSYRINSQENDYTQEGPQEWTTERPGYCYILSPAGQSGDDLKIDPCLEPAVVRKELDLCPKPLVGRKEPGYTRLADLSSLNSHPARCSCIARSIFVHFMLKNATDCVLYVTDSSLKKPHSYVKVKVQSVCDFLHESFSSKPVILLRDLYIEKDKANADEYTKIVALTTTELDNTPKLQDLCETVGKVPVVLPELGPSTQQGDLCTLSGCIYEVDEDSAYSWEICTKCGSEQLQEEPDDSLMKCVKCRHTMVEPKTMMKMEVMVQCDKSECRVKVDLLQSTIETVLPREEADEDGYELSSVLRKSVGPLACIINRVDPAANKQQSLILKEIELL